MKVLDNKVEKFTCGVTCGECKSELAFSAADVFMSRHPDGTAWLVRCGACRLVVDVGALIPGWLKGRATGTEPR